MRLLILAALLAALSTEDADAMDFSFNAYADASLVVPPGDGSWLDGDLGKLHFGYDDGSPNVHFVEAIGEGRVQITPELIATATARLDPNYGATVDLIESWIRYRPVSTSEWSWSIKAGAFFPPNSLENTEIGWTDFWTITPSALNSWIADEIRIIGAEGTLQWRRADGPVTLIGAIYGWNENAGEVITDHGFTMDDRATGLFEATRLPDATAAFVGGVPPIKTHLFRQFDDNPGWYIDLSWEPAGIGSFEVMRYDNDANPTVTVGDDVAWHTSYWEAGFEKQFGALTLMTQGLDGTTLIEPAADFRLDTNFRAAYALLGLDLGEWWLAARADWFQTPTTYPGPSSLLSEDGHAGTVSASYQPLRWMRLTGEFILCDSTRDERTLDGEAPRQIEKQFQLALRLYY